MWWWPLSTGTGLRTALAAVVVLVNALDGHAVRVLPWALLVVAMDLTTGLMLVDAHVMAPDRRRMQALAPTLVGALGAGLALEMGAGALPLVVIPAFRAGEQWTRRGVAVCASSWAVGALVSRFVSETSATHLEPVSVALWGALAVSLGILTAWARRITPENLLGNPLADEAAALVSRLDELAANLDGGFDPATSAEQLLDALGTSPSRSRSAVLIGSLHDRPVPLALRGAERVPWVDPLNSDGAMGVAWREGRPAGEWDQVTHRAIVAVPVWDSQGVQIGILVTDEVADGMPSAAAVAEVCDAASTHGTMLGLALAFARLRERAGLEERERLAREMHDGIAQELVALGYQLDAMRRLSRTGVTDLSCELAEARTEVSRILGDLRSHIGDLRVSVRPEQGLGATMSARLQQFGTTTGIVVSLRLNESGFRLPAQVETGFYRLFLDVLADAKHSPGVTLVDVDLTVLAPEVTLVMRHDGGTSLTVTGLRRHMGELGAELALAEHDGRVEMVARFRTPAAQGLRAHVAERVPQPS